MIGWDTIVLYEVSLRLQAGTGQMVRPWGAHTQTTHTHSDRAPAYTRSSTHIEAGINDSASLKYIYVCTSVCVFWSTMTELLCLMAGLHADVSQEAFFLSKGTEWHPVRA